MGGVRPHPAQLLAMRLATAPHQSATAINAHALAAMKSLTSRDVSPTENAPACAAHRNIAASAATQPFIKPEGAIERTTPLKRPPPVS
eukprot:2682371-Pyramimonas_sp.AAC.1